MAKEKHVTTTWNCSLRHGGSMEHEIPLFGVTDRELVLLRAMHGDDSVYNVKEVGSMTFDSQRMELMHLARKYANTADPLSGAKLVQTVFNASLHDFQAWLAEQVELEQMEREEQMRARQRESVERERAARAEDIRAALLGHSQQPTPAAA